MRRKEMLSYDDGNDRMVVQEWFLEKENIQLTEGSKYEVDLLGEDFDVEISHLSFPNLWNQWQREDKFRIEIRKRNHYWNGLYNKIHTTHFVQLNKDSDEMLLYPQNLIMEHTANEIELEYLKGFNLKERTFMYIPFESGKNRIRRYNLNG